MIRAISVSNVGCFDEKGSTVDFLPETIMAGCNNLGKSTILSSFLFLRECLMSATTPVNVMNTAFYSFGNFQEMVYRHDTSREARILVEVDDSPTSRKIIGLRFSNVSLPTWEFGSAANNLLKVNSTNFSANNISPTLNEALKKIWFISAVRNIIPRSTQIGGVARSFQPIDPTGSNIIEYLLGRWADRDSNWELAEYWLKKIDPDMKLLKAPLNGVNASLRTVRGIEPDTTEVSLSSQGAGIQNALSVMSAIIFSPEGSTIILEEPEAHLDANSQENLVDLMNYATTKWNKQVITITHSWDILQPFVSDIGEGSKRGVTEADHVPADKSKFSLVTFARKDGIQIKKYQMDGRKVSDVHKHFKQMWG